MTTVTKMPSQLERFVLPDGRMNPVWYRWFARSVGNKVDDRALEASVTEFTDQLAGVWGVAVNINGEVTGLVQLDGGSAESTFDVVANLFRVSQPGISGGAARTIFAIGLIDGVAALGLAGNAIIDGTILARHIDVDTLSALAADIGEVTAGVIRSADSKFVIDLDNKTLTITA